MVTIYEQLMLTKRIHYVPYWLIIGTLFFAVWEGITRAFGESRFLVFRLLIAYGGIAGLIILTTNVGRSFHSALCTLEGAIKPVAKNYEVWADETASTMFSLKPWLSKFMPLLFMVSVTFTVLIRTFPFQLSILNIVWIVALQPFLAVSGYAAYGILALLYFLTQVIEYPIDIPFYRRNHPGVEALSLFYSYVAFLVVVCYMWLLLVTWQSPYGFITESIVWLIIIGFLPLSAFLWSVLRLNVLTHRIRQAHLDIINQQVQTALNRLTTDISKENAETLSQVMDIQYRLEQETKGQIRAEQILALLTTLIAPFGQILISLLRK